MCTVSNVGDMWGRDRWPHIRPDWYPNTQPTEPIDWTLVLQSKDVTRKEFDDFVAEMRKELAALKELLLAAKKYDAATGQPDCEQEEKIALFKRLAQITGVDLSDIFAPTTK